MKKIIIETLVSSEKTAIVEDDKLVELLIDEVENIVNSSVSLRNDEIDKGEDDDKTTSS